MNRLTTGGGVLIRRLTAWWSTDGIKSGIARIIGTMLGVAFGGGLLLAAPTLWWPLAGCWLIACWYAQPTPTDDDTEQLAPGAFLTALHQLIGDEKGVHLAQIAASLLDDETNTGRVRELCDAAGVPISRGVRVKDRGVSTGVRREALPPLPDPSESAPVAVVAAGQSEQQQQQHPDREGFITILDPDGNPRRHEIHWITQPTRQAS